MRSRRFEGDEFMELFLDVLQIKRISLPVLYHNFGYVRKEEKEMSLSFSVPLSLTLFSSPKSLVESAKSEEGRSSVFPTSVELEEALAVSQ